MGRPGAVERTPEVVVRNGVVEEAVVVEVVAAPSPPQEARATTASAHAVARADNRGSDGRCLGGMVDVFWFGLMIAVAIGLMVIGFRMEPHWCSSDGGAFTCRVQNLNPRTNTATRWTDARAEITDRRVVIRRKVMLRPSVPGEPLTVLKRASSAPKGKVVFLLDGEELTSLRIPAKSRAVARLDELATR
ncbi:MAG TPA: hypothetical protein VF855_07050 [Acidimicrobiales bacterium]